MRLGKVLRWHPEAPLMHLPILPAILLGLMTLGTPATAAQPEFPYAAGTDHSGRAQAVSDAAGRVLIESPEFPRGLWVDLVDEAGRALAGVQVKYEGWPDGLVVLRCGDPSGLRQETLLWTRPGGSPLRLALKPGGDADLPEGLVSLGWRIDPQAENLLEPYGLPLTSWEELTAFLQERRQGGQGRAAVQIDGSTALVVDLAGAEPVGRLVEYLEDRAMMSLGNVDPSLVQVLLSPHVLKRQGTLFEGAIVLTTFVLVQGSELEKWILGRWRSGPVTWSEAAALTRLHVSSQDIVDVSPLAALTNLEELGVIHSEVADVGPLAALTGLKRLELYGNQIIDISSLAALTNLEWLALDDNEIVDVSPLGALTNLEGLRLHDNEIVDISPLGALTNLEWLGLVDNEIVDVGPLAALTRLDWLSLAGNKIVDVGPLSALTNLAEGLHLTNNAIVDVSPLAALTNLTRLHLTNNAIADVSPLSALASLDWLRIADNEIVDAGPLAALTNLEWLELDSNEIADVTPLAALTNLESLSLGSNAIVDVSSLASMTSLRGLNLSDNEIDLNSLAALTNLPWLELRFIEIVDISPLAALTNLEGLDLSHNDIADISPLAALTKLDWLGLDGNKIVDLSSLADLTNLDRLRLNSNQIQDISALVANPGLSGYDDWVLLEDNPLSDLAIKEQIPALRARGVDVHY